MGTSLFDVYPFTVVSLDYIKSDRRRDDFARTCPKLVIVDEAHTCAFGQMGRGGRQQRNRLVTQLAADAEGTRCRHKDYLLRRIAWRLQANAEGDLSNRARRRAAELAADADVRLTAPRKETAGEGGPTRAGAISIRQDDRLPLPGTVLTRQYKGETVEVRVLPHGFEHAGAVYRTLSAVAILCFSSGRWACLLARQSSAISSTRAAF
jgi:hypothetical protein